MEESRPIGGRPVTNFLGVGLEILIGSYALDNCSM